MSNRARLLACLLGGGLLLGGCATTTPGRVLARDDLGLGTWPYQVGPITVRVMDPPAVDSICRARMGRYVAGTIRGCYFQLAGREHIVTVADWGVVLHEFKHALEGDFHP